MVIITVKTFSSVSKEQVLYKSVVVPFITFSAGNIKSMGSFQIQLSLPIGAWHSKFIFNKNTDYSSTSTEWNFLKLDFREIIDGLLFFHDQIDTALAYLISCKIIMTLSVLLRVINENYFKSLFESIPEYRKNVFLKIKNKKNDDSLNESRFSKKKI